MKTKSNKVNKRTPLELQKRDTMHTLNWYLDVGYHYGTITKNDALRIARVNPATFYRWLTGKATAPAATLELIRMHAYGEPPSGRSTAWRGFRFQNDQLITEDGRTFTPADLKAVFYWKKMAFARADEATRREIYSELRSIYNQA